MSLLERLQARASAARVRVEELRDEMAALGKELAAQEAELARWGVAEGAVLQLMEEEDLAAGRDLPGMSMPPTVAAVVKERTVVSAPVTLADGKVLREANEGVVLALASAGRPLRGRPICEAVGWETGHRAVERMRVKLKSLVKQGRLTEEEVGLFAIAPGVGDAPTEAGAENDSPDHIG
ncbi:hypothetical protein [Streptomyces sp. NRRL S-920]|uniref:hypothetical protein n=1 Tax=Streptomyces sp. NRRL S-920 TaxID=1463921 RepID=UPI000690B1A8|nr:hypothetical protein [Streptomyces sp. NRRL S-920]